MKSTMRNQFTGVIKSVDVAPVTAQVVIALSAGPEIVATMTRSSAERLKLKSGVPAIALIKAPSIALVTDLGGYVLSARNQFAGTVSQVERGSVNSKVVLVSAGWDRVHVQRHKRRGRGARTEAGVCRHGGVQGLLGDGGSQALELRSVSATASPPIASSAVVCSRMRV